MRGLLYLEKEMSLKIKLRNRDLLLHCTEISQFENAHNSPSTRYLLVDETNKEHFILDVQKDLMHNVVLTCYQLIEEMAFDLNFLSLVGTSPLGYHNPLLPNIDYVLYEKIENFYDNKEMIKFLISKEDLPKNPDQHGYYQDGNGNWYFMSERTKGALLKFSNDYKLVWEYKQEKDERLLIEMKAFGTMHEYMHRQPAICIYEGQRLHRKDIKILSPEHLPALV